MSCPFFLFSFFSVSSALSVVKESLLSKPNTLAVDPAHICRVTAAFFQAVGSLKFPYLDSDEQPSTINLLLQ